jgi:hypothetical protein
MMGINMVGVFEFMIAGAIAIVLLIGWAIYSVYDYMYIPEVIVSNTKIEPILEIRADGNKIDTLFIYKGL